MSSLNNITSAPIQANPKHDPNTYMPFVIPMDFSIGNQGIILGNSTATPEFDKFNQINPKPDPTPPVVTTLAALN